MPLQTWSAIDGFYGMIRIDGFALVFKSYLPALCGGRWRSCIASAGTSISSANNMANTTPWFCVCHRRRMMFLGSGYDLISLYISLELMAITFMCWSLSPSANAGSNEAGMKYFLLGAFSSGHSDLRHVSALWDRGFHESGVIGQSVGKIVSLPTTGDAASLRPMLLLE